MRKKTVNLTKFANSNVATLCFMTFFEWPLSCLVTQHNRRISWLISFLSQNLDGLHGFLVVVPFVHRSYRSLGVDRQLPVVSLEFSSGCRVRLVFRCELIQLSALFFRPPDCHLSFAIGVLILTSFQNRLEPFLFRFSQTVYCPVMILLFFVFSMFCTARCLLFFDEVRY